MMTLERIIPQIDGWRRYVYRCDRGAIAIDLARDGRAETTVVLGYRGSKAERLADVRKAEEMFRARLARAEELARAFDEVES